MAVEQYAAARYKSYSRLPAALQPELLVIESINLLLTTTTSLPVFSRLRVPAPVDLKPQVQLGPHSTSQALTSARHSQALEATCKPHSNLEARSSLQPLVKLNSICPEARYVSRYLKLLNHQVPSSVVESTPCHGKSSIQDTFYQQPSEAAPSLVLASNALILDNCALLRRYGV
ncbi:hypothetical protein B0H13DRAFT_2664501 [Mycena leptocephala]|nr:hypothetical protein B0H13DRAFT_2674991 [Mycena leptocephala]KAJ7898788.1 hypothetical protein B0H13DRAFT_2664501 [Mycena leptocephala]